jgi:hypothetical protein
MIPRPGNAWSHPYLDLADRDGKRLFLREIEHEKKKRHLPQIQWLSIVRVVKVFKDALKKVELVLIE